MAPSTFVFPGAQTYTPGDLTQEGNQVRSANPPGPATGQPSQAVGSLATTTPILGVIAVVLLVLYLERRRIKRGIK